VIHVNILEYQKQYLKNNFSCRHSVTDCDNILSQELWLGHINLFSQMGDGWGNMTLTEITYTICKNLFEKVGFK